MSRALLVVFLVAGCTVGYRPIPGDWTFIDGGPTPLTPEEICASRCDQRFDRCINAECACGTNMADCNENQLCFSGTCVESDPNGSPCVGEFNFCETGFRCIEDHCTRVVCSPEECDGVDNDCDDIVDNFGPSPLARWCFNDSTPANYELLPPCAKGTQICTLGVWSHCEGEHLPVEETGLLACNGIDDSCSGCVDGHLVDGTCQSSKSDNFDVVFVIDTSGSMEPLISATKEAVLRFSSLYTSTEFKFGLVLIPSLTTDGIPGLDLNLSPLSIFQDRLMSLVTGNGGAEPSYDAVFEIGNGILPISWRLGSNRIIIMFTDEEAQSLLIPRTNEATMCESLDHGELVAILTQTTFYHQYEDCGNVRLHELTTDVENMYSNLVDIIQDPCNL